MKKSLLPSHAAFLFILLSLATGFIWWAKNKPSTSLYRLYSQLGKGNQAAVITEYKRLLKRKDLPKEEEIRLRNALGEFYVDAYDEKSTVLVFGKDEERYEVSHPFLADAKQEFKRVLELDPRNAAAHLNMGRILWMEQLEKFALEELEESRKSNPQDPRPLVALSRIQQERGNPAMGRELALQALAIDPKAESARLALVEAYASLGENEKALREFDKLSPAFKNTSDVAAKHALYLAEQNYWKEALWQIENAVQNDPQNGEVRLIYGRILLSQGLFDEAAGQFAQGAALFPHSAWPYVWRAKASALRGQVDEASRIAELLTQALPRWSWSYLVRAWANVAKGQGQAALSDLEEATRLSPDFSQAISLQAEILLDQERFEDLGNIIRPQLDRQMNQSNAYAILAQSFYLQNNSSLLRETAQSAIKFNERNPWPYIWLGLSMGQSKDFQGGERAFQTAINLMEYDRNILGHYAFFRFLKGDLEAAQRMIRELISKDERNANLLLIQGNMQMAESHEPEAIQSYLRAVDLKPYLLSAQLGLAEAYLKQNQITLSENALSSAMKINSKNPRLLELRHQIRRRHS